MHKMFGHRLLGFSYYIVCCSRKCHCNFRYIIEEFFDGKLILLTVHCQQRVCNVRMLVHIP